MIPAKIAVDPRLTRDLRFDLLACVETKSRLGDRPEDHIRHVWSARRQSAGDRKPFF
jgi:hypothetical protein